MKTIQAILAISLKLIPLNSTTGYKTVGSSGCSAQMVFLPPYTDNAVFVDDYHPNFGGPGYDIATGAHSKESYLYPDTKVSVFGTVYDYKSNKIRTVRPASDIFRSAGAFFSNGSMVNVGGVEGATGVAKAVGIFDAEPCTAGVCNAEWEERSTGLQVNRWYPSSLTMVDGSILVVGGSNVGGLVLNEASINVPTYEIIRKDSQRPKAPHTLPILEFTAGENLDPGKSYNLYPIIHTLPNAGVQNYVFTIAGNRTVIWDYTNDVLVKSLPDTPLHPRTFPSSATAVLLPLTHPHYEPTVLVCGGSSGDMPAPKALSDCWRINPNIENPLWWRDEDLPNGPQTMSDGIHLPNGQILILNGAHSGSAGALQADDPVLIPLLYDPTAELGSRFTSMPPTTIPRLYNSVATLLPTGEVMVAGSNPVGSYSLTGSVNSGWPHFDNNGHRCALEQQQRQKSSYPTEYRVEIFSPPYLSMIPKDGRVIITAVPKQISYGTIFVLSAKLQSGKYVREKVQINLVAPGIRTHGQGMGQRMIQMGVKAVDNSFEFRVDAPRDASVMPPGVYLLFVVNNGIPSEGEWVSLG